jgi:hypothetical protein
MPLNKNSIFYDILNISKPWEIAIMSYSKQKLRIDFEIDYDCNNITCPICGCEARIIGKTPVTWRYLDFFQYSTHMTAYIPLIDNHNSGCKVDYDSSLLSNTLLLDIMVKQLKNTRVLSPLHFLFNANSLDQAPSKDFIEITKIFGS